MALELALVTPVLIAFLMLMAGVGRMVEAQSQVDGAARDGARAASVGRSQGDAATFADRASRETLKTRDWCQGGPRVAPDLSEWAPGGQVTVTVTCDVDLGGMSLIGLPGTKSMTGTATVPLDTFRRTQ
ncbi:MAG: TadE family protein [Streptosporangiaceae bacterium]|nr:TadE family protein [Streptosporangiaceae bacterium]